MKCKIFFLFIFTLHSYFSFAQAGISINTTRLFFKAAKGASEIQKIGIRNPNDKELEIGVSFGDWQYDSLGQNQLLEANVLDNSCTNWIKIQPSSYFTLKPNENKEIEVILSVPEDADTSIKLRTGMIYLTQLNPDEGLDENGAALKVSVRMAVKLFHNFPGNPTKNMEITDFKDVQKNKSNSHADALQLTVDNTGESWINGKVDIELTNVKTGQNLIIPSFGFYSLPGDHTYLIAELPKEMEPGNYNAVAIIHFGDKTDLKVAELEFDL